MTMRVGVIVATLGRPVQVGQLLERLTAQTMAPCAVVLSVEKPQDLPANLPANVEVVMGSRGLPAQRNRALEMILDRSDIVAFFDDDFVPARNALEAVAGFFETHHDVVSATGRVLKDGINKGGIDYAAALAIIAAYEALPAEPVRIEAEPVGAYGCNMAFRAAAIGQVRFDENLPLYAWQEDMDFTMQLRPRGRVVKTNAFAGVHLGVVGGRTSGVRTGFSQMVNPLYLVRKGTMDRKQAAALMIRNFLANHAKLFRPEPWVDRKGRARGNWLGLLSVLLGEADPMKVLQIASRRDLA